MNRSLVGQGADVAALGASLAFAIGDLARGIWVVAAAVVAAEILRHVGHVGLMARIVGFSAAQLWESYAPAAFANLGVASAIAVTRHPLVGRLPTMLVFAAELAVLALALAVCIRICPPPGIRRELRMRLDAGGVLGAADGWRRRPAPLVVGRLEPAPKRQP
jgi:hypothetical protein